MSERRKEGKISDSLGRERAKKKEERRRVAATMLQQNIARTVEAPANNVRCNTHIYTATRKNKKKLSAPKGREREESEQKICV